MDIKKKQGQVRVGTMTFGMTQSTRISDKKSRRNGKVPSYEGFTEIKVMTRNYDKKWFKLGPYVLKTKEGYIHENVWQRH